MDVTAVVTVLIAQFEEYFDDALGGEEAPPQTDFLTLLKRAGALVVWAYCLVIPLGWLGEYLYHVGGRVMCPYLVAPTRV